MALVRLCRLNDLVSLSQLAQWLDQAPRPDSRAGSAAVAGPAGRPSLADMVKKKPLTLGPETIETSPAEPVVLSVASWPRFWPQIVATVGAMLGAELSKAGTPAISGPNNLAFRFPASYNQAREYCQQPERLARVEDALRRVTGQSVSVRIEAEAVVEVSAKPVEVSNSEPVKPVKRSPRELAEKSPLAKRALEVLGAAILRVDDAFGDPSPDEESSPEAEEA
jgi:DNA polymerase-3 subunit gamma/tau